MFELMMSLCNTKTTLYEQNGTTIILIINRQDKIRINITVKHESTFNE